MNKELIINNKEILTILNVAVILAVIVFAFTFALTSNSAKNFTASMSGATNMLFSEKPVFITASVEPTKIRVGDIATVATEIKDKNGIEKVSAIMPFENGVDEIQLFLISGDNKSGLWQGQWEAHNTINKEYVTIITAVNILGKSTSKEIAWWDDTETGWLSGWNYRKKITITGETGAGTDYQVPLSIGDSAGGDFHLEGNCQDFPNDIRFTDGDGGTELDYWIDNPAVDPITAWIEVTDDLGSNVDIYVYYGKSGESTTSNGRNTFIVWDDFDGGTEQWSETDPSGHITIDRTTDKHLKVSGLFNNEDAYAYISGKSVGDFVYDFDFRLTSELHNNGVGHVGLSDDLDDGKNCNAVSYEAHIFNRGVASFQGIKITGQANWDGLSQNTTYYTRYRRINTTVYLDVYSTKALRDAGGNGDVHDRALAAVSTTWTYVYAIQSYDADAADVWDDCWLDNYLLRKYALTEPALDSYGSEEKRPSVPGYSPSGGGVMIF
ncbi:DUF2341 domain-containing protein [Patescibacteria group bacterium]